MGVVLGWRSTLMALCVLALAPAQNGWRSDSTPRKTKIVIHNVADDFVVLYDETAGMAPEERRDRFKRHLGSRFAGFYRPQSPSEAHKKAFDERIDEAVASFAKIRAGYERKVERFEDQIDRDVRSFVAFFDDFPSELDVHLIHSLGAMDGGTRTLDGVYTLIFGADLMTRFHDFENETPFFHHELFHFYQNAFVPEDDCAQLWCHIWIEGLAVHAARVLNPSATHEELLLAIPPDLVTGTEARLHDALLDLRASAFSESETDAERFLSFRRDETGLPLRRGYYLGLLVAEELARSFSLKALAHMPHEQVQPYFMRAVDELIERAR